MTSSCDEPLSHACVRADVCLCVCARVHCTLDGSDKYLAVDAVDFAVAILAAMPYTRLTLNVAVCPASATSSGEPPPQVHTDHLSLAVAMTLAMARAMVVPSCCYGSGKSYGYG